MQSVLKIHFALAKDGFGGGGCMGIVMTCRACGSGLVSLGTRPSHAEEEEGLVNLHTYKFEVYGISAE